MKDLKDKKILFVTFIVLLLILTTSLSYAYFSTSVRGNENAKNTVVETGTLKLTYTDSPEIVAEHIKPGWTTTKVVTVKNTGTLDTAYNLVWQELTNEITNDELVISATCQRLNASGVESGTCYEIYELPVSATDKISENISIESGITHKYIFTITFKETNSAQDYNQNKKFNGVLGIEDVNSSILRTDIPSPVYCDSGEDLVQGLEVEIDGYIYRYMQEYTINMETGEIAWFNMDKPGWGIKLSENPEEFNSDLVCTYINEKPIISMSYLFYGYNYDSIDLSNLNTSNVINMAGMFQESKLTSIDLSHFDTSKVTNMTFMFNESQASTIDISNFNTSNVKKMMSMFSQLQNLKTIYANGNLNTESVDDFDSVFYNSENLVGGQGTKYNENNTGKEYARIDGGSSNPGYFTLK